MTTTGTQRVPDRAAAVALMENLTNLDPPRAGWPTASSAATLDWFRAFDEFSSGGLNLGRVLEVLKHLGSQEQSLFGAPGAVTGTQAVQSAETGPWAAEAPWVHSGRRLTREGIAAVSAPQEVAAMLGRSGHDAVAYEITRLSSLAEEDPDEPKMDVQSLRELALFLVEDNWLPEPVVGVGHEGLLTAEWRIVPSGGFLMRFLPSGPIQYAGVVGVRGSDIGFQSVNGRASKPQALRMLRSFTDGLTVQ